MMSTYRFKIKGSKVELKTKNNLIYESIDGERVYWDGLYRAADFESTNMGYPAEYGLIIGMSALFDEIGEKNFATQYRAVHRRLERNEYVAFEYPENNVYHLFGAIQGATEAPEKLTSPAALNFLSYGGTAEVRKATVLNGATPLEGIIRMMNFTARLDTTPFKTLEKMAEDPQLRLSVMSNKHAAPLYEKYQDDENPAVRKEIAASGFNDVKYATDVDPEIRSVVATMTKDISVMDTLVKDSDMYVRNALLYNNDLPISLLRELGSDFKPQIRSHAHKFLPPEDKIKAQEQYEIKVRAFQAAGRQADSQANSPYLDAVLGPAVEPEI